MLKIFNYLKPFFIDCYRRVGVREYAKMAGISPPTASKLLSYYESEGLLKKEAYRNYILFHADTGNREFIHLSRMYWSQAFHELTIFLEKELTNPTVVLFGSLSKAENKQDSDIDIAIFAHKKELDMSKFEGRFRRKIQVFWFNSIKDMKNADLANNIINGCVLAGRLVL
jgi:predicted nucleotidyltransferase